MGSAKSLPSSRKPPINVRREIYEFLVESESLRLRWTQGDLRRQFHSVTDDVELHLRQLEREGLIEPGGAEGTPISLAPTFSPVAQFSVSNTLGSSMEPFRNGVKPGCIALDLRGIGVPVGANMRPFWICDASMIDAGLLPGDLAFLCDARLERGQLIAVEVDGRLTIRRYLVVHGMPHILAENPDKPDLRPAWNLQIQGVFWGSVRFARLPPKAKKKNVSYSGAPQPRTGKDQSGLHQPQLQHAELQPQGKPGRNRSGRPGRGLPVPPSPFGLNEANGSYEADSQ